MCNASQPTVEGDATLQVTDRSMIRLTPSSPGRHILVVEKGWPGLDFQSKLTVRGQPAIHWSLQAYGLC